MNPQELETRIPGWGVDRRFESRPGVPMVMDPHPAPGAPAAIEPQASEVPVLRSRSRLRPATVYGTMQPPHGLSGLLRRAAYKIEEHKVRRWLLLLLSDRVDVLEHGAGRIPGALALLLTGAGFAARAGWQKRRARRARRLWLWMR